jgi:5-methylcytosine-specific restriction endonuclease McrA
MNGVLVLNTDDTALHTVSVQHAVGMLVREVAIVESARDGERFGPYPHPRVLRLVRYVKTGFLYSKTPSWTKRGVLRRDKHQCGYCGAFAGTVDHILPLSRGGQNTWLNTVACCAACNTRKSDRTPEEAGMPLLIRAYAPTRGTLLAA